MRDKYTLIVSFHLDNDRGAIDLLDILLEHYLNNPEDRRGPESFHSSNA